MRIGEEDSSPTGALIPESGHGRRPAVAGTGDSVRPVARLRRVAPMALRKA